MNGTLLSLTTSIQEPLWACDPQHIDLLDPNFDAHGLYTKRAINTLSPLADVFQTSPQAVTEFRQPLQVQSHLEMPGILVQLGHIQRT